ncbi:endoglucanase 3 [Hordeum vulgare]|nr:endoglucanase 3 [Hordeum vulgare]
MKCWTEWHKSWEGVHEVQAIQCFIYGCRDDTLGKQKLICSEPTSLASLMGKEDKYATTDSAMRIKISAMDKTTQSPATAKPAGDNPGGQNNKRKADQPDPRPGSQQVANVEEESSAAQAGAQGWRTGRSAWQPKLSIEKMLDMRIKMHTRAKSATHTLQ